ncbi:MAG TPA: protein-glutamate O-methyltransferase CheR, partial [Roseateles sp.]|nr:protein-glutamate O-methyltransferase CheR [Roseateles sp.]
MIEQVEQLLHRLIGLDTGSVGRPLLARALQRRMTACGAADSAGYWQRLQQSLDERQALVEAVVVPETWFFRYPESFAILGAQAQARRLALAGARPLRLLSLPCASGEEPYSAAMCLLDAGFAAGDFRIDALDVSARVIAAARQARYGANAFRSSDLAFRERHFQAEGDGYRLNETVRQAVSFGIGNLLDPALQTGAPVYDFLFCRNLLIYFDAPTQRRALERLERLLDPAGVLF